MMALLQSRVLPCIYVFRHDGIAVIACAMYLGMMALFQSHVMYLDMMACYNHMCYAIRHDGIVAITSYVFRHDDIAAITPVTYLGI